MWTEMCRVVVCWLKYLFNFTWFAVSCNQNRPGCWPKTILAIWLIEASKIKFQMDADKRQSSHQMQQTFASTKRMHNLDLPVNGCIAQRRLLHAVYTRIQKKEERNTQHYFFKTASKSQAKVPIRFFIILLSVAYNWFEKKLELKMVRIRIRLNRVVCMRMRAN